MKKILLIEDQVEYQDKLIRRYSSENCNIDIAESGMEAFYFLNKSEYNTVIVSNDLSDLDGLWIVQKLCKNKDCKVILTSLFNHKFLKKKADKIGVGFISKPINN